MITAYLNGIEVDLVEKPIEVIFSNNNEENFLTSFSYSRTIDFPLTGKNKAAFQIFERIDTLTINTNTENEFIINDSGMSFVGHLEDFEANISGYSAKFVTKNGDWGTKIQKINLNELDYSDLNHVWNATNIQGLIEPTNGICYLYVNYGDMTDSRGESYGIAPYKLFPSFQISTLLEKLFKQTGYTISDSNFYKNVAPYLWIPFTKQSLRHTQDWITQNTIVRSTGTNTDISLQTYTNGNIPFDTLINNNSLNYSTIFKTFNLEYGKSSVTFNISFQSQKNTTKPVYIDIVKGSILNPEIVTTVDLGNLQIYQDYDVEISATIDTPVTIYLSDKLCWLRIRKSANDTTVYTGSFVTIYAASMAYVVPDTTITFNQTMELNQCLPDLLGSELLQGLNDLFNLKYKTNDLTKEVFIEFEGDFYKRYGNKIDWTSKLHEPYNDDKSPFIRLINSNLNKQIRFKYKEDSKEERQKGIGEINNGITGIYERENVYIDGISEKVNRIFHYTIMSSDYQAGINYVPTMYAKGDLNINAVPAFSTDFGLRILFHNTNTDLIDTVYNPVNIGGVQFVDFPYAYSYDALRSFTSDAETDNSLLYCDSSSGQGLLNKYFYRSLYRLDHSKVLEAYFKLTPIDIANLDIQNPIYISTKRHGNGYFIIDSIEYVLGSNDLAKVRLISYQENIYTRPQWSISDTQIIDPSIIINNNTQYNVMSRHGGGSAITSPDGNIIFSVDRYGIPDNEKISKVYVKDSDGIVRNVIVRDSDNNYIEIYTKN